MIEGAFYDLFSDASKARARRFMVDLNRVMRQFFRGQFTVVIILAVVYTSVYSIMGVRYALLFGIFSGLANVVPYLGPTLATILPMSIALFTSVELAVGVLIISVIIQQIEGNIITPRILGSRVELHPLIIILAVLAGGRLFGLGGMLFAIPMAGTIKVVIRHFIRREHMQLF
jgi:predicted PurR-regulated permease PerM